MQSCPVVHLLCSFLFTRLTCQIRQHDAPDWVHLLVAMSMASLAFPTPHYTPQGTPLTLSCLCYQATQDKVQALIRLSDSERSVARSSNQLNALKKQNQDLTQRLSLATQEKVNALMQLADGTNSHSSSSASKGAPSPQKGTWKVGSLCNISNCCRSLCNIASCITGGNASACIHVPLCGSHL